MQLAAEADAVSKNKPVVQIQGVIIKPARKVGIPALQRDDHQTLTLEQLQGHWSLLFFGYTHCPDVCPTTMHVLAQTKRLAEKKHTAIPFPEVYFVSVDPARDTPEQLAGYVDYFDKDFTGVTGDDALLKALTLQLSAVYLVMPPDDPAKPDEYTVDHSAALYLLNPEGKLVAFLNEPFTPEKLVDDISRVQALDH